MTAKQHIFRVRRNYNQWVANQTLEDYALRFTAKASRRWTAGRVAATALGAISFLALEAIGGAITIHYGFDNALVAILAVSAIIFLTAIPISYYAAKYGLDIDLLTRGAGFGYIGSTITSLIYASFTFIFFALEAAIMAMALDLLFGIPLALGYLISSLVIIPMVVYGITFITRFQLWSQPLWIILQLLPFVFIIYADASAVENWTQYSGNIAQDVKPEGINILLFGAASAVVFSLIAQIGEQVDFLRFMPEPKKHRLWKWWIALIAGGPGWIVIGAIKILAGSFLAVLALNHGISQTEAADPTRMYMIAFSYIASSPEAALSVAGIFVILSQLKINVTNAYAGSIAWSNFFSRLTHSHPGRVVWLVFNVAIALLLMELGVYRALEQTLGFYAIVAVAWLGSLVADLIINKPLGLSPKHIEFKRAHLYDINPVGFGSMILSSLIGILCHAGFFGDIAQAVSHFITLAIALITAPTIAWYTKGRYYLARPAVQLSFIQHSEKSVISCCICEHKFESEDMTHCPAYAGYICSLCCSLDVRCQDYCKPGANYREQLSKFFVAYLPGFITDSINSRLGHFLMLVIFINGLSAILLSLIYFQTPIDAPETAALLEATLWKVFFLLVIVTGVVSWLFVLAHESRLVAQEESQRQTRLLMEEIDAHDRTDKALQQAKETAEAANQAKSRYLTGISHELRSPLNAILGYAQLLEKDIEIPEHRREALSVIRHSGEHLADLIEGLLDISKIEAGRLDLHQDPVRINSLLEQLVNMFRMQAQAKGLLFHFHCKHKLPEWVKTDEKRLRQILINLLSNAVKYTSSGAITFSVAYRSQVAEFIVQDTGEGIATENLERIFRPFERVSSRASGTGLGLTITRLLTEIMGGDISVTSQLGKGSQFKINLMLSDISYQQTTSTQSLPAKTPLSYQGNRRRLVVVDDDLSHRQLMTDILLPVGFTVMDFSDPLELLTTLSSFSDALIVDLFLLDVSMPGIDGWQLAKKLRALGYYQPIVMVSADASEGKNISLLNENNESEEVPLHQAYVTKPVRTQILFDHLGRLLNLQWLYEKYESEKTIHEFTLVESVAATSMVDGLTSKTELIASDKIKMPLNSIDLDEIARLAAIGHKKGLVQKIRMMLEERELDKTDHHLLNDWLGLAKEFQFDKLAQSLDEHVNLSAKT